MTDKLTRDEGIVHAAVIATMQCLRLRSEVDFEAAREAVKFALGLPEIRSALAGEEPKRPEVKWG